MIKHKILLVFICTVCLCSGLPVIEKKEEEQKEKPKDEVQEGEDWELSLEYGRYLKQVVQALESDPEFRKKLETADADDIKSGKISRELHLVDHNVRTKLDELKRIELERLRRIAMKEHEKKVGVDRSKLKIPAHIDHKDPSRFEPEDLRRLIMQLNQDLEKADKEREKEFKTYEMDKQLQYQKELEGMDEEHKKKAMQEHEDKIKKHKDHPKLHHPGSKTQLEEVWEEQDHMKNQDFDPNVFFHAHDLDGNGYWDQVEVKALFQKELDKMYDPNAPEDDLNERYEEMERMRSHVFGESDTNKDNLISFDEFMEQTRRSEFERDEGWKGLDEEELYSQQEFEEFERQRQNEIQHLIDTGAIPPPPGYHGLNVPQPLVADPAYNVPHVQQGYQAVPQGQVYQDVPQGQVYQGQGYQVVVPQGHQAPPGEHVPVYQGQGGQGLPNQGPAMPQAQAIHAVPPQAISAGQAAPQKPMQPQVAVQGQGSLPKNQQQQQIPQQYQQMPQQQQQMPQQHQQYQQVPQQQQQVPQQQQQVPQHQQQVPQHQQQVPQHQQQVPQHQQQVPQHQQQVPQHQQQVLQQQPGGLNQHPEIKPVVGNQIPGSK